MSKKTIKKINSAITAIILSNIFFPSFCSAMCLKDCENNTSSAPILIKQKPSFSLLRGADSYQYRSPEVDDVKNGVLGDMNIKIGHERVDIRTESSSSSNTIDASINSTIILGDMNK